MSSVSFDFQSNKRELARRQAKSVMDSLPVVKCAMISVPDPTMPLGYRFEPEIAAALSAERMGMGYGVSCTDEKEGVIYCHIYPGKALALPRGMVQERPSEAKYLELVPPYADKVVGHSSYAHVYPKAADDFNYVSDPLSASDKWTGVYNNYTQADGSKVIFNAPGAAVRYDFTYFDDYEPPSPDYSTEATCYPTYTGSKYRTLCPSVRQDASLRTGYYGRYYTQATSEIAIQKWVNGSAVNLATLGVAGGERVIRIEAVGDGASVALVLYYGGEATSISANDTAANRVVATGFGGLLGIQAPDATGDAYLDDWQLLDGVATGSPAAYFMMANRGEIC